ncbi:hypothetical protein WOSG25_290030 [Weissella oryzae SG25]|uniref:Uncharacterized protein n=1 Tax=Weissella oryzae (strain DSM 25784 / JCM 18191 / LMG 30913 / SG25) TaxID=1329250 RepID=A0A069CX64_WEIOS|nr:hypothetical protein [Weissella oryzae]GAK32069.1 hypothetical protein WOSG25_290030 [Weissella oryzae SG25]
MAKYKVQINDCELGLMWVIDEFLDENGRLVDTGSVYEKKYAESYSKAKAEQIAGFLRKTFSKQGVKNVVEVVE